MKTPRSPRLSPLELEEEDLPRTIGQAQRQTHETLVRYLTWLANEIIRTPGVDLGHPIFQSMSALVTASQRLTNELNDRPDIDCMVWLNSPADDDDEPEPVVEVECKRCGVVIPTDDEGKFAEPIAEDEDGWIVHPTCPRSPAD